MGQSTNAYLFYGFHLSEDGKPDEGEWFNFTNTALKAEEEGEELEEPNEDDCDWEHVYARKMGEKPPPEPYEGNEEAHSAFWRRKDELRKAATCTIDTHCSAECGMPFVAIVASFYGACRGDPTTVESIEVGKTWDAKLRAFCELMDLPYRQPQWWLASDWT